MQLGEKPTKALVAQMSSYNYSRIKHFMSDLFTYLTVLVALSDIVTKAETRQKQCKSYRAVDVSETAISASC